MLDRVGIPVGEFSVGETMNSIATDTYSAELRDKAIRPGTGAILISRIAGSDQEADLTEPPNCDGYGRIRHFRLATTPPSAHQPATHLPASHALGLAPTEAMTAQVFQNAACNWRCWYCFVPFQMLTAIRVAAPGSLRRRWSISTSLSPIDLW